PALPWAAPARTPPRLGRSGPSPTATRPADRSRRGHRSGRGRGPPVAARRRREHAGPRGTTARRKRARRRRRAGGRARPPAPHPAAARPHAATAPQPPAGAPARRYTRTGSGTGLSTPRKIQLPGLGGSGAAPSLGAVPSRVLVVADAHLGQVPAAIESAFHRFLAAVPDLGQALLINGDLFDFWFEYRAVIPRRH